MKTKTTTKQQIAFLYFDIKAIFKYFTLYMHFKLGEKILYKTKDGSWNEGNFIKCKFGFIPLIHADCGNGIVLFVADKIKKYA